MMRWKYLGKLWLDMLRDITVGRGSKSSNLDHCLGILAADICCRLGDLIGTRRRGMSRSHMIQSIQTL